MRVHATAYNNPLFVAGVVADMLTDRFVRNAKPGTYADEEGLYLRVLVKTRVFVWRRRVDGKDKWEVVGHYPDMSLAEAREKLARMKRLTTVESKTVTEAFNEYYDVFLKLEYKDPGQTKRMFERDVLIHVGEKQMRDLEKTDWTGVVQKVVKRGARIMANRVLAQIKKFLEYSKDHGWIEASPLADVKRKSFGGKETPVARNLSWEEIVDFLEVLLDDGNNMAPATRWTLYLTLLTTQRSSEVLGFKVSKRHPEFMTGDVKLTTDGPKKYKVPLTPEVRAAMKFYDKHPRPKDHRVMSRALNRLGMDFTPHNMRHTFASRMADLHIAFHVVEKMQNHKMVGAAAIYNRGEYWDERVAAQRVWGKKIRELRREAKKQLAAKKKPGD